MDRRDRAGNRWRGGCAGQQCRRRRRTGDAPDRGGAGRRLGPSFRGQRQCRLHVEPGCSGGHERAGSGRIINISSGAGLAPSLTGIQAYCSAKHAVVGLTRQLAHELGPFGITVNSVAPGFVRSNAASEKQWAGYGEEEQRALVERIAMKRQGTPQDIANSVVFFASELAGFVNGQVLAVDGGK